jgi:hypothetical protein
MSHCRIAPFTRKKKQTNMGKRRNNLGDLVPKRSKECAYMGCTIFFFLPVGLLLGF